MLWIFEIWGIKLKTFLFLTKINFFLNFFYFAYVTLIEIFFEKYIKEGKEEKDHDHDAKYKNRQKFINSLFKFSFCLSVVVNILYWTLNIFIPSFLGNTEVPLTLDYFLHGGNLLVLLIDYMLNTTANFKAVQINHIFLLQITILYLLIQYFVYYTMDIQVYPMISKMSIPFYSMFAAGAHGLFLIGNKVFDTFLMR
jgi:hypothetical protein